MPRIFDMLTAGFSKVKIKTVLPDPFEDRTAFSEGFLFSTDQLYNFLE